MPKKNLQHHEETPPTEIDLHIELPSPFDNRSFSVSIHTSIRSQGITALFGPSGAGKTTALRALTGLPHQPHARVHFGHTVLQNERTYVKPQDRRFFYVSSERQLFPHMTVMDNWRFAQHHAQKRAHAQGSLSPTAPVTSPSTLTELAERFDLLPLLQARPHTLSTGEAQKASLIRAMLTQPRLLLLDEPLGNIDYQHKHAFLEYIKQISQLFSMPILYVSHHPTEVCALAQKVLMIDAGRITTSGPTQQLRPQLMHSDQSAVKPQRAANGVISLTQSPPCDFSVCHPATILSISPQAAQTAVTPTEYRVRLALKSGEQYATARRNFLEKHGLSEGSEVYYCQY